MCQRPNEKSSIVHISAALNYIGMYLQEEFTRQIVRACTVHCAHARTHIHKRKHKKKTHAKPNVDMPNRDDTNQNKACKHKEIQRMKKTERIAQSHLSNKCEDASNAHTHTHTLAHTIAHKLPMSII